MITFLSPEGGTRREWVRFHVGWWLARRLYVLLDIGEWAGRVSDRVVNWAERA